MKKNETEVVWSDVRVPFSTQGTSEADTWSPPRHFTETPHAKFAVCQPDIGPRRMSGAEILNLNTYDFMAHLGKTVINPGGNRGRDLVLEIINPQPGARLLEIGCGTGYAACHIARRYRCHVTAIDISPTMIETAQQVVQSQRFEQQVDCRVGDITHLPFADDTFDYVICQAVLMFVDKPSALREIRRVLRPRGGFAGLEFSWRREPTETVRESTYRICGCRTLEFHSASEWEQQLTRGGLHEVKSGEQPFTMLSIPGFVRDEGLTNSLKIFGRVLRRKANIQRMGQIWGHFSRNIEYFSYVVLSGAKLSPQRGGVTSDD